MRSGVRTADGPADFEVRVHGPGRPGQAVELLRAGRPVPAPGLEAAVDRIAELAVPWEGLGVPVDGPVQLFVELLQGGQPRDRAPRDGTIALARPSPDFERILWDAL